MHLFLQGLPHQSMKDYLTLPRIGAVYWLLIHNQIMYVGVAANLRKRITRHYHKEGNSKNFSHNPEEITLIWYAIDDMKERLALEQAWLVMMKPLWNKLPAWYKSTQNRNCPTWQK